MNAQKEGAAHIPHFKEFERVGMKASLVLEILPNRLRDVIGNRAIMQNEGQKIIKNLLLGMLELKKLKMVLRNINPNFIALDDDYEQLQFCSLDNVAKNCKQEEQPYTGDLPYCCQQILKLSRHLPARSCLRDQWSIGMIVLEVLVGTEAVIPLSSVQEVEELLECVEEYVDAPTIRILKSLLIHSVVADVEGYVQEELVQKPGLIAKNVRALDVAFEEDGVLQDMSNNFKHMLECGPEELESMHSVTAENVQRKVQAIGDDDDEASTQRVPNGKYKLHNTLLLQILLEQAERKQLQYFRYRSHLQVLLALLLLHFLPFPRFTFIISSRTTSLCRELAPIRCCSLLI